MRYWFQIRGKWWLYALMWVAGMVCAQGLDIESRYSPLNRQRSPRKATEYIILHTTEGGGQGESGKAPALWRGALHGGCERQGDSDYST